MTPRRAKAWAYREYLKTGRWPDDPTAEFRPTHGHIGQEFVPLNTFRSKLEAAYALHLEARKIARQVLKHRYEGIRLRLAKGAHYTPDFFVVLVDGSLELHEVKGFWREAARVRIKVAAELFPEFRFLAVRRVKGEWIEEKFAC